VTASNVFAAKAIRAELRTMVKNDARLTGAKISVTAPSASLMADVEVTLTGYLDGNRPERNGEEVQSLARDLWMVVERHWQADGRHRFASVYINGMSF
jgi:hypothetical protein